MRDKNTAILVTDYPYCRRVDGKREIFGKPITERQRSRVIFL
ncbi:hypothetical protein [Paenibacillus lautus]|nr:hypothetical protein [Paenibacillus lautus]MEC0253879.1 hypothetical protein [Paenibacillus lautus]